jgi:CspA family cold shock protein
MTEEIVSGEVKWFNAERGYGFILKDGDESTEYFVHYSYIQMDGYKTIRAGQRVTFKLVETDKGIQAQDVTPE